MNNIINKVVLTGGPCSGKSSALSRLKETYEGLGINVLVSPESATHLFSSIGVKVSEDHLNNEQLQRVLIKNQLNHEKLLSEVAGYYKGKTLIILDRGVPDSKAYIDFKIYEKILKENGLSDSQILSAFYNGVIHMVTAANGAEQYYTCENNSARKETPQEARDLDDKLIESYVGTQNRLRIIDNSTDFNAKLSRVEEVVSEIMGIPRPIEIDNKFLVGEYNLEHIKEISKQVKIEQIYLSQMGDEEEYIRRRDLNNERTYFYTSKKYIGNSRVKTEKIISEEEYNLLKKLGKSIILKTRYYFVYKNQYFEMDLFDNVNLNNGGLLEIKVQKEGQKVELPDFFTTVEDVSNNQDYRNSNMSVPIN